MFLLVIWLLAVEVRRRRRLDPSLDSSSPKLPRGTSPLQTHPGLGGNQTPHNRPLARINAGGEGTSLVPSVIRSPPWSRSRPAERDDEFGGHAIRLLVLNPVGNARNKDDSAPAAKGQAFRSHLVRRQVRWPAANLIVAGHHLVVQEVILPAPRGSARGHHQPIFGGRRGEVREDGVAIPMGHGPRGRPCGDPGDPAGPVHLRPGDHEGRRISGAVCRRGCSRVGRSRPRDWRLPQESDLSIPAPPELREAMQKDHQRDIGAASGGASCGASGGASGEASGEARGDGVELPLALMGDMDRSRWPGGLGCQQRSRFRMSDPSWPKRAIPWTSVSLISWAGSAGRGVGMAGAGQEKQAVGQANLKDPRDSAPSSIPGPGRDQSPAALLLTSHHRRLA